MGLIRDLFYRYKSRLADTTTTFATVLTEMIEESLTILSLEPTVSIIKIFDHILCSLKYDSDGSIKLDHIKAMADINVDSLIQNLSKHCHKFSDEAMDYLVTNYDFILTDANIIDGCSNTVNCKLTECTMIKLLAKFEILTNDHINPILNMDLDWPNLTTYLLNRGLDGDTLVQFFYHIDSSTYIDNTGPEFINLLSSGRITVDRQLMVPILAIFGDNLELTISQIECLIKAGADPRHENDSLFAEACGWKDQSVAIYLYTRFNCDVNATDSNGNPSLPLHKAMRYGNDQIIRMLLDNGAKPTADILLRHRQKCLPYIDYFLSVGLCPEQIAGLILQIFLNDGHNAILKMLVKHVDFAQILTPKQ